MTLNLPTRTEQISEKIDRKITGFNGSIFVHVDYIRKGDKKQMVAIRLSEKGKDGSTLDHVLTAIGDTLTDIVRRELADSEARG